MASSDRAILSLIMLKFTIVLNTILSKQLFDLMELQAPGARYQTLPFIMAKVLVLK
jgi:hypothetical protein